jgi:hypothetical protein
MKGITVVIDGKIFLLHIVKSALYVLSERIDGRICKVEGDKVTVKLFPIEEGLSEAEMERVLHRELIVTSVNEHAFRMAAPIRNLLAQTAFSITTESQKTIEEFAASLGSREVDEHAGAPLTHVHISPGEEDDLSTPTKAGNRLIMDEEKGWAILWLDARKYLLPEILRAASEMRETCNCSITNLPGNQLLVEMKVLEEGVDLARLVEEFEHWLEIAVEHLRFR